MEGATSSGEESVAAWSTPAARPNMTTCFFTEHHQRLNKLDDKRIQALKPLIPPQILMEDLPLSEQGATTVLNARAMAEDIIKGKDDRLLVVCGPCSIHDTKAALEYASLLKEAMEKYKDELVILMRVYFEKPRTTVGWKGLINDPFLDDSFQINKGLRMARKLLCDLNDMGVPAASEFLDTISPQYIGDLVSWGAIGARTTESQVHRELASGISSPVGFKNGTDGGVRIAIDALKAVAAPHHFLSVTKQGLSAIVCTTGNDACHVILRGGNKGPNYSAKDVDTILKELKEAKVLNPRVMIDCSHGNSSKNHRNQPVVCQDVAQQVASGNMGIFGLMIESHLEEGRQDAITGAADKLKYGQSITDACVSWQQTLPMLDCLAQAVRSRRATAANGQLNK